jgi:hypothetical protein
MNAYVKGPDYVWASLKLTSAMLTRGMHIDRGTALGNGRGIFVLDSVAVWCKVLGQLTGGNSMGARVQKGFFEAAPSLRLTAYRKLVRPVRDELGAELRSTFQTVQTALAQASHPKSQAFQLAQTLTWEDKRANFRLVRDLLLGFEALPQYQDESLLRLARL